MAYGSMTMEERLKEHIKEYSLENLLDLSLVKACFEDISKVLGIELLLTQRHGETAVEVGNFAGFEPDVVNDPGRKLRVFNRTIGHLYVKMDQASDQELAERIVEHMMLQYEALACDHYRYRETAIYADELEEAVEQYKLGLDMASQCQKMLRDAEGEIRILQDGVEKAFQMEE